MIPATEVGSANGSSIQPSRIRFPGNSYLTSTQAMITPNTLFISAAINEHPMLVANACRTVGFVIRDQNSAGRSFNAETITDANGISTIRESIVTVIPNVR